MRSSRGIGAKTASRVPSTRSALPVRRRAPVRSALAVRQPAVQRDRARAGQRVAQRARRSCGVRLISGTRISTCPPAAMLCAAAREVDLGLAASGHAVAAGTARTIRARRRSHPRRALRIVEPQCASTSGRRRSRNRRRHASARRRGSAAIASGPAPRPRLDRANSARATVRARACGQRRRPGGQRRALDVATLRRPRAAAASRARTRDRAVPGSTWRRMRRARERPPATAATSTTSSIGCSLSRGTSDVAHDVDDDARQRRRPSRTCTIAPGATSSPGGNPVVESRVAATGRATRAMRHRRRARRRARRAARPNHVAVFEMLMSRPQQLDAKSFIYNARQKSIHTDCG